MGATPLQTVRGDPGVRPPAKILKIDTHFGAFWIGVFWCCYLTLKIIEKSDRAYSRVSTAPGNPGNLLEYHQASWN